MIQHIAMVLAAEGLNGSEKLLLIAYCNHTDGRGYVTAGIPRLADETGTSERTVKRVNAALKEKKLIKSKRRVDPRTGEPIPNLTRVNLNLLAEMKRPERDYDDSLIEALTFESDATDTSAQVSAGDDLAQGSDLLMGQSDPDPSANLSPTRCQSDPDPGDNLAPNPYPTSVRTDPDPDEAEMATPEKTQPPQAVNVSDDVLARAAEMAARLDLARLDAKPKQIIQITQALAEALTRPDADPATVERYAAAKVTEGRTVKYLLNGFSPERLTIGLPAYRTAGTPVSVPVEACATHPGASRRADGECAGCWADRADVSQVPHQADAPEQEAVPAAEGRALLAQMLQTIGRKA
jgi:hypothetical protein